MSVPWCSPCWAASVIRRRGACTITSAKRAAAIRPRDAGPLPQVLNLAFFGFSSSFLTTLTSRLHRDIDDSAQLIHVRCTRLEGDALRSGEHVGYGNMPASSASRIRPRRF